MEAQNARTNGTKNNPDDKLSGEEFVKLIPHLHPNILFRIELQSKDGSWSRLFRKERDIVHCKACLQDFNNQNFKDHLQLPAHLKALDKVAANLSHPLYTAKTNTDVVILSCIADFFAIEYQMKGDNKFEQMITQLGETWEKKFLCRLCNTTCGGIITVHNHMRGHNHRLNQQRVQALRSKLDKNVSKTSTFKYEANQIGSGTTTTASETRPVFSYPTRHVESQRMVTVAAPDDHRPPPKREQVNEREALIGVEYVACVSKGRDKGKDSYVCTLCAKPNNKSVNLVPSATAFENHLIKAKHRLAYIARNYPNTLEHFDQLIKQSSLPTLPARNFILTKLAAAIEDYHGYGTPFDVEYEYFLNHRDEISKMLEALPHACQKYGPSFSNAVALQDLEANKDKILAPGFGIQAKVLRARFTRPPKGKTYLNIKPSTAISRAMLSLSTKAVATNDSSVKNERKSAHSTLNSTTTRSRPSRFSSPNSSQHHHHHHHQSHRQEHQTQKRTRMSSPFVDVNVNDDNESAKSESVWRIYRERISKAASDLENSYLDYRQSPEQHPKYNDEWSMFWKRRKTELQQEGKDHRSYDFQPEWNSYFRQRMEQLFSEDLQRIQLETRRELNIPYEAEEDAQLYKAKRMREAAEAEAKQLLTLVQQTQPEKEEFNATKAWQPTAAIEKDRPNVIGVLRLMTALDDHLGSMGEKVLNLLTKALALEKKYAAEQLERHILTASNCQLLKAAQEKLRSQLYADLVEEKKIKSFNRVIESAEILLNKADEMGWSSSIEEVANPSQLPASQTNRQIEQLLEALKSGGSENQQQQVTVSHKKPLTDTLMELMAPKKVNSNSQAAVYQNENSVTALPSSPSLFSASEFSGVQAHIPNFPIHDNSSDVWNRLGGRMNHSQEYLQPKGYGEVPSMQYGGDYVYNSNNAMANNSARYNYYGGH